MYNILYFFSNILSIDRRIFCFGKNEIVANNIAILRKKKNRLSLEELGKLSGVSKSMLALIEKGDGNPTLGIL